MHKENSMITLTYSDENLPKDYSLCKRDLQLFMKRFRKNLEGKKIRYFACGEYGDQNLRPHYHAIIFGHDFYEDRREWRVSGKGNMSYRSAFLEEAWGLGHAELTPFNKSVAQYVARYTLKKMSGPPAEDYYERVHPLTGEIVHVMPEFALMSSRPGLGAEWFDKFESDCFPHDEMVVDGEHIKIPRYFSEKLRDRYKNQWSNENALVPRDDLHRFRMERKKAARDNAADNTPERLAVREESLRLKVDRLKREL